MNESSPFTQFGPVRRLVVTIVVGSAAAVTASVVLNEHPAGAAGAKPATAATAVAHFPHRPRCPAVASNGATRGSGRRRTRPCQTPRKR